MRVGERWREFNALVAGHMAVERGDARRSEVESGQHTCSQSSQQESVMYYGLKESPQRLSSNRKKRNEQRIEVECKE